MAKQYLKGFAELGVLRVLANASGTYTTDSTSYRAIPGARKCDVSDNKTDFTIPGDDGIWDEDSEWNDTTLTITINEAKPEDISFLTGAAVSGGVVEEGTFDRAPEVALTFSALRADGSYRLFRYYACKCTGYKVSHTTKGESTDAQTYELTFKCIPRKLDNRIRGFKDVPVGDDHSWLRTVA